MAFTCQDAETIAALCSLVVSIQVVTWPRQDRDGEYPVSWGK